MGTLLVVDGSSVCRAPVVAFTIRERLADTDTLSGIAVEVRGVAARPGSTMCESASARLGYSGPAIAFFGSYRAAELTVQDVAAADLILTAERAHRSAVVRMLPGTQMRVFTWKEALMLTSVLVARDRRVAPDEPGSLAALARALHSARGTAPVLEPSLHTGPFHWRRTIDADPLSITSGHDGTADHRRAVRESADVAAALGDRMVALMQHRSFGGRLQPRADRAHRP